MDKDLETMSPEQLCEEIMKLRTAIRNHRDSSSHDLCWYVPELWNVLPEKISPQPVVPEECEFITNCVKYRKSLERK